MSLLGQDMKNMITDLKLTIRQRFGFGVRFYLVLGFIVLLGVAACSRPAEETSQPAPQELASSLDPEAIAANNRGVGLMGRFEYTAAAQVF